MEVVASAHVDVVVVGAGFSGLAVAAVCADAGLSVAILERRETLAPEGVAIMLQPNGLAVLDGLGVLDAVQAVGHVIPKMLQCNPSGRVLAEISYADLRHPHPYLIGIERRHLISLLVERLPRQVTLHTDCTMEALHQLDSTVVGVDYRDAAGTSRTVRAGCVVGADGVNSAVRQAMGSRSRNRTRPERYVLGLAPCPPEHEAGVLYCGPGWCNGVMPFGDHTYFFDYITPENRAALQRHDFDEWREVYVRRVPGAERLLAGFDSFDDLGYLSARAHRALPRIRPGVALVGDAAAAVHPHAGQGANLALEDALALGRALSRHGPRSTTGLREYARPRDAKARRYVPWSILIGRTLDAPGPGWRAMRGLTYAAGRVGPVRRAGVRQAAGLN